MAFLAPLYLLAGLAVAGPILFHLIRRSPRGKQDFSSLMFLQPSPPTVTRRSRIDDWLLLLLRGLALLLIVLAFSRPFWRTPESKAASVAPGREIVLLVDTSASLRRSGVWEEVERQLAERLSDISPADQLHLWAFSREVRPLLTGEEWLQIPAGERLARARERVAQLEADWERTEIADALISAAEQLAASASDSLAAREIWLISDLQEGAEWDALPGYNWPAEVVVQIFPVGAAAASGNVAVQVIDDERVQADQLRVRLTNPAGTGEQLFLLGWRDGQIGAGSSWSAIEEQRAMPVTIPAGQSLVVRAPPVPGGLEAPFLELLGDEHPFDNRAYIPRRTPRERTIVWLGDNTPESQELRLFLNPAFPSTPRRTVRIVDWLNEAPSTLPVRAELVICAVIPSLEQQRWLQELLAAGTTVLHVARNDAQSAAVGTLLGSLAATPATAGSQRDYWMLGRVDFHHPLLKPFDDPRFGDFTRLRFWKKYALGLEDLPEGRILWEFEDRAPALMEWRTGPGRLFWLASSWSRADSEMALWTKFPPLLNGLLELGQPPSAERRQLEVGESLPLENWLQNDPETRELWVQLPESEPRSVAITADLPLTQPGIVKLARTLEELQENPLELGINLSPGESRLSPLSREELVSMGIRLHASQPVLDENPDRVRQLLNAELEARQNWWQVLLAGGLLLLVLETLWSGRRAALRPLSASGATSDS